MHQTLIMSGVSKEGGCGRNCPPPFQPSFWLKYVRLIACTVNQASFLIAQQSCFVSEYFVLSLKQPKTALN